MRCESEEYLEDLIMVNISRIEQRGLHAFYKHTKRQFRLPCGPIPDIFTYEVVDDILYARIIELKKDKAEACDLWQAINYLSLVKDYAIESYKGSRLEVSLVAGNFSDEIFRLGHLLRNHISLYYYEMGFDGLIFEKINFRSEAEAYNGEQTKFKSLLAQA